MTTGRPFDILDEIAEISKAMDMGSHGRPCDAPPPAASSAGLSVAVGQQQPGGGITAGKPFVARKSPRGIQDMMMDFDAAAAGIGGASSAVQVEPFAPYGQSGVFQTGENAVDSLCSYQQRDDRVLHVNDMPSGGMPSGGFTFNINAPTTTHSTGLSLAPSVIVPPSSYKDDPITPWFDNATTTADSSPYLANNDPPPPLAPLLQAAPITLPKMPTGVVKPPRNNTPFSPAGSSSAKVMPPTAKSILERRERAIREGRRHEARLNDEERRILRRLRNRESAERCARRKMQQASSLSVKIAELEAENKRLREIAAQCSSEVVALEGLISSRGNR